MKKIIIYISSILFLFFANNSFAATGKAAVYKVTMIRAALCTGNASGTTCDGATVLGDSTMVMDIAAVDAGATAATYGDAALLPLGQTYTHFQVRLDRKFTVKTSSTSSEYLKTDNGDVCQTIANASGMYATDESTDKYTHIPAITEGTGTTLAEMNVYLMNAGSNAVSICTATNCSSVSATDWDYDTNTYTVAQKSLSASDSYHEMIYALDKPYTVSMIPPKLVMSFGTANALLANDTTGSVCRITAQEPVFTIKIE